MWVGIRQIAQTLRREQRLVCPWKPRTVWYEQLATTVGIFGAVVATGYAGVTIDDQIEEYKSARRSRQLKADIELRLRDPIAYKKLAAERKANDYVAPSDRQGFNDPDHRAWHNMRHWPSAVAFTGLAAVSIVGTRIPFILGRRLSETLCEQGRWFCLSGTMFGVGTALALRGADHAYAYVCKANIKPEESHAAWVRHSNSFLRRSSWMHVPLADYF
jgi:hypothetical protein